MRLCSFTTCLSHANVPAYQYETKQPTYLQRQRHDSCGSYNAGNSYRGVSHDIIASSFNYLRLPYITGSSIDHHLANFQLKHFDGVQ